MVFQLKDATLIANVGYRKNQFPNKPDLLVVFLLIEKICFRKFFTVNLFLAVLTDV